MTQHLAGIAALFYNKFHRYSRNNRWSMAVGLLICVGYATWINFLRIDGTNGSSAVLWPIFTIACLIGAGSSVILVTALAITADLIGNKSVSLILWPSVYLLFAFQSNLNIWYNVNEYSFSLTYKFKQYQAIVILKFILNVRKVELSFMEQWVSLIKSQMDSLSWSFKHCSLVC